MNAMPPEPQAPVRFRFRPLLLLVVGCLAIAGSVWQSLMAYISSDEAPFRLYAMLFAWVAEVLLLLATVDAVRAAQATTGWRRVCQAVVLLLSTVLSLWMLLVVIASA